MLVEGVGVGESDGIVGGIGKNGRQKCVEVAHPRNLSHFWLVNRPHDSFQIDGDANEVKIVL